VPTGFWFHNPVCALICLALMWAAELHVPARIVFHAGSTTTV